MLHHRDTNVGWLRPVWCVVAVLCSFALLTSPGLAATQDSQFRVAVKPPSARPGESVAVSFSSLDPGVAITGCQAKLDGQVLPACAGSGNEWSVHFTVPKDAKPGARQIGWGLTYPYDDPDGVANGNANGSLLLRVLPSSTTPPTPSFKVASPQSARPAQTISVTFSSLASDVAITGCTARLGSHTYSDCHRAAGGWSLRFTVPDDTEPGTYSVQWTISYARGNGGGNVAGDAPLAVLASDPAGALPDFRPLLLAVFALFALVGLSLAVLRRPPGPNAHGRSVSEDPPLDQRVRAAAHAGSSPRLSIRDPEPGGNSRVVRFAVHRPSASSDLKEVP